jgi:50S ribosomal protein L16 3-hydroxylase
MQAPGALVAALLQNTRTMKLELLGGLAARTFLRRHWQKRPLFVPRALPDFRGAVTLRGLRALAARDDVESRIAARTRRGWKFTPGPVEKERVFPARNWTLLVSGVNLHVAAADRLLRRFAFLPQARLDDVMVSYAAPGGGVGPHVDSYDVFLVQGPGRRRWTIWEGKKTTQFLCGPGDLLYLPPGIQHDGVALEPCFTYSVGFRAPKGRELAARFLDWLHERGLPDAQYRDPGRAPTRRAAQIPDDMLRFAGNYLERISWSRRDVAAFVGEYLTAPKPHVVFRPGRRQRPLDGSLVVLDPKSQLLYSGSTFFMNGDALRLGGRNAKSLRHLADKRSSPGSALRGLAAQIMEWHGAGYLHLLKS